jgi:hypothetical protein
MQEAQNCFLIVSVNIVYFNDHSQYRNLHHVVSVFIIHFYIGFHVIKYIKIPLKISHFGRGAFHSAPQP